MQINKRCAAGAGEYIKMKVFAENFLRAVLTGVCAAGAAAVTAGVAACMLEFAAAPCLAAGLLSGLVFAGALAVFSNVFDRGIFAGAKGGGIIRVKPTACGLCVILAVLAGGAAAAISLSYGYFAAQIASGSSGSVLPLIAVAAFAGSQLSFFAVNAIFYYKSRPSAKRSDG